MRRIKALFSRKATRLNGGRKFQFELTTSFREQGGYNHGMLEESSQKLEARRRCSDLVANKEH